MKHTTKFLLLFWLLSPGVVMAQINKSTDDSPAVVTLYRPHETVKIVSHSPIGKCVLQSSRKYRIDPYLLWAIKMVESGKSMDGGITGNNTNGTQDLGLMQINNGVWLDALAEHKISAADLADPCTNIEVGAWILAQQIKSHGLYEGIGRYHSGTPKFKIPYREKVLKQYEKLTNRANSLSAPSTP